MTKKVPVFRSNFDLEGAIGRTKGTGYSFASHVLSAEMQAALETEIDGLPLEFGNHVSSPINAGQPNEVKQQHARAYYEYGDQNTPAANLVINSLARVVQAMRRFPELVAWQPTEIGYQRYRPGEDFIGPHKDRSSDQLLSFTFTIAGSATVKIFETPNDQDPLDYSVLEQVDQFTTTPGSLMLLRAPGFGGGEQTIHQVLPPTQGIRNILNLRMRPTVLEQPSDPKWQTKNEAL